MDLKLKRYRRVIEAIARWEAKERRAKNALKKLRKQRAYYLKNLGAKPGTSDQQRVDRKASAKANRVARGNVAAREIALKELYRTEA